MTVIVACNDQRGGDVSTEVANGPQRPLDRMLRESHDQMRNHVPEYVRHRTRAHDQVLFTTSLQYD